MPVIEAGPGRIDYIDQGDGPPVVLVHSSVSGNRQWRKLAEYLAPRYRSLAINLYGYGETSAWPRGDYQTLDDQVDLIEAMVDHAVGPDEPVHIVGHSFGGAVAMKAAVRFGPRTRSLILYEGNPFYLLKRHGKMDAYEEILELRDAIVNAATEEGWEQAGRLFSEYWMGPGSWDATPPDRQETFLRGLQSTYHEFDGVSNDDEIDIEAYAAIPAPVVILQSTEAKRPILELAGLLLAAAPNWTRRVVPEGGHMAPLTRPDVVNPMIAEFLDEVEANA